MRAFCLIILFTALALRLIAFATENSAEAAPTSTPAAQTVVQITR